LVPAGSDGEVISNTGLFPTVAARKIVPRLNVTELAVFETMRLSMSAAAKRMIAVLAEPSLQPSSPPKAVVEGNSDASITARAAIRFPRCRCSISLSIVGQTTLPDARRLSFKDQGPAAARQ
jgi:hypothetical protein